MKLHGYLLVQQMFILFRALLDALRDLPYDAPTRFEQLVFSASYESKSTTSKPYAIPGGFGL